MKNVLIVHAHPESNSFCSAKKNSAIQIFKELGFTVHTSELYEMNFMPVGGKADFKEQTNPSYFKYQTEQVNAFQNALYEENLKQEMDKLLSCDILVFSFPLWWFGLPAILKGWVDRVFAMGLVYGAGKGVYENGYFKGKKAFLMFTTGGPEMTYGVEGKNGELDTILFPIHHGMFYFTGFTVLKPFISFSPVRMSDEERKLELELFEKELKNFENRAEIKF